MKAIPNQYFASAIAIAFGVIGSLVILKVVDLTIGVRVAGEDEIQGLDLSQHGEEGYNFDLDLMTNAGTPSGSATSSLLEAPESLRMVD